MVNSSQTFLPLSGLNSQDGAIKKPSRRLFIACSGLYFWVSVEALAWQQGTGINRWTTNLIGE
jgi:hypothetical protein